MSSVSGLEDQLEKAGRRMKASRGSAPAVSISINLKKRILFLSFVFSFMLFSDLARVGVIIVASPVSGKPT